MAGKKMGCAELIAMLEMKMKEYSPPPDRPYYVFCGVCGMGEYVSEADLSDAHLFYRNHAGIHEQ